MGKMTFQEKTDLFQNEPKAKVWRVCQTRQGQERLALENLEGRGFEAYLPMHLVHCMPKGQPARNVGYPLFPTYVFVKPNPQAVRWNKVYSTRGVKAVLNMPVKDRVIAAIQAREIDGYVRLEQAELPAPKWQKGEAVTYDGYLDAIFQEAVDGRRAMILLRLLGSESLHEVALAKLS
jgi:hypothetical protein